MLCTTIIVVILRWVFKDFRKDENAQNRLRSKETPAEKEKEKSEAQPTRVIILQPRKPSERVLKECGPGGRLDYSRYSCGSTKIAWEDPRTGELRVPQEQTMNLLFGAPFRAGGKNYISLKQLKHQKQENDRWLDVYGREWQNIYERYPCFDSEDYLNEKRYFEWYFLQDGDRITRVFDNGSGKMSVTDDTERIESHCLDEMKKRGYLLLSKPAKP